MSIISFKRDDVRSGPRLRTPSPPRDAYEPLTPPPQVPGTKRAGFLERHPSNRYELPAVTPSFYGETTSRVNNVQQTLSQKHQIPGAIQPRAPTSPTRPPPNSTSSSLASPVFNSTTLNPPRQRHREENSESQPLPDERPNKRARSELLRSPEYPPQASRPSTSHIPSYQWLYGEQVVTEHSMNINEEIHPPIPERKRHPSEVDLEIAQSLLSLFSSTPRLASRQLPSLLSPSTGVGPDAAQDVHSLLSPNGVGLPVPLTVQTHTPPEDPYALSAQAEPQESLQGDKSKSSTIMQASSKKKSTHRRSSASTPGRKASVGKSAVEKDTLGGPQHIPEQLHSPQSLGLEPYADRSPKNTEKRASEADIMAEAKAEVATKPRRLSTSNLAATSDFLASVSSSQNRAVSVPTDTGMTIGEPAAEATAVASTREGQVDEPSDPVTVCAGCNFASTWSGESSHWISCDGCGHWFHFACAGFKNEREVRSVDKFFCRTCRPVHGPTTYVRKSKRTHAAVDYAGLNEGVIRTPEDSHEHHYIQRIKEGGIEFQPERFPRIRPELLTIEFFEKGSFTEPVVIPAALNPRPGTTEHAVFEIEKNDIMERHGEEIVLDDYEYECVLDEGQDSLDMVIPQGLTVRRVAEMYGPDMPVEVIEVKSQEGSDKRWNMQRWADYYEEAGDKIIRNVISLEVSSSKLGRLIRRPKVVRDLDLQDAVWPQEEIDKGVWPKVQFYCLMSVADCYTDFHIDFGGSSVYYHIVKGSKTFFFIPPTQKNLKSYEEWCLSPAQNWTFLGDHTKECYRIDLSEGDTMLIPSGWIHAVWTPTNSLVIGGNFLTRLHLEMQIKIAEIERNTKVARKFRYPHFQKLLWYTVLKYLDEDPIPQAISQLLNSRKLFPREKPIYLETENFGDNSQPGPEQYNTRYYSKAELDGLPALVKYIWRTVRISLGVETNVTQEVRNAVTKAIPKGRGDPLEIIKTFAAWTSWKRGNEVLPEWAYLDAPIPVAGEQKGEKKVEKLRPVPTRQMPDRKSLNEVPRQSPVVQPDMASSSSTSSGPADTYAGPGVYTAANLVGKHLSTPKTSQLGPKRIACDACRKRRIRCKHKDDVVTSSSFTAQRFGSGSMQPFQDNVADTSALSALAGQAVGQLDAMPNGTTTAAISGQMSSVYPDVMMDSRLILDASHFESGDNKKGRNKACVDCRRSKRRCIHDENGAIDPIKAQEAKIPRGSHKKRRPSGEDTSPSTKRTKKEDFTGSDMNNGAFTNDPNEDSSVAVANGLTEIAMAALGANSPEHYAEMDDEMAASPRQESPLDRVNHVMHEDTAVTSIEDHIDPELTNHQPVARVEHTEQDVQVQTCNQAARVNGLTDQDHAHSSPFEDQALTSPRFERNGIKSEPGTLKSMRHSSRALRAPERFTPEQDQSTRRVSHTPRPMLRGISLDTSASKKKSPGSYKHSTETPKQERKIPPIDFSKSKEQLEDEASRKLARELQELEFGLRRRSK